MCSVCVCGVNDGGAKLGGGKAYRGKETHCSVLLVCECMDQYTYARLYLAVLKICTLYKVNYVVVSERIKQSAQNKQSMRGKSLPYQVIICND